MGPRTVEFRDAVRSRDLQDEVYLAESSAALLWKHPVMTGSQADRAEIPSVAVSELEVESENRGTEIVLSGRLASNGTAHSVVLADDVEPRQTDYWRKTYVGKVAEDGTFTVRVTEANDGPGTFRLVFCFENGCVTGDGKTRGLDGAPKHLYRVNGRRVLFRPAGS